MAFNVAINFDSLVAAESACIFSDPVGTGLQAHNTGRRFCWHNGQTASGTNTVGPTQGQGGVGDGYVYTEASSPAAAGDQFFCEIDQNFNAATDDIVFSFYRNQNGAANEATFQVQTSEAGGAWVNRGAVFGGAGQQTNATTWVQHTVDLTGLVSNAVTRIRIAITLAASANVWHQDAAIDSLNVVGTTKGSGGGGGPAGFTKVSNTEVSGTGTIAELITTINNATSIESVGLRCAWIKGEMTLSGAGSELTIPSGWKVDVGTFLRAETGASIIVGSEDVVSPDQGASIYFDNATPAPNWTYGSMDASGTGRWEVYNSVLTWNSNGNNNRPLTCGFDEPNTSYKIHNSVLHCEGTNGSFYLGNIDIKDSYLIGSRGGELINTPVRFENVTIKKAGTQGYKIYPSNVTVVGVNALSDSDKVFSIGNGKTYTIIDSVFEDSQFLMNTDGANQAANTAIIQYSVSGRYSIGGVAQSDIQYGLMQNDNTFLDSGTIDVDGNITPMINTVYTHNNGTNGADFSARTGNWFAPWIYRARSYNTFWAKNELFPSAPADISTGLSNDVFVTQSEAVAQAHTGITLTDHGTTPVTWQGLSFGITITVNTVTNPSVTLEDVKHYLKYHLSQNAAVGGKASGLMWHDLIPMSGASTVRSFYFGSRLSATATASATTISFENTTNFPSAGVIKLGDEEISYTAKTVSSITGCTRGVNGTSAVTHTFDNASPLYSRIAKGVRVVDQNNDAFLSVTGHASDTAESYSPPRTLTFTGLKPLTEIRVYKTSDGTELSGIENVTDSWSTGVVANEQVNVVVYNVTHDPIYIDNLLMDADKSIPIQQIFSRNYANN